MNTHAVSSPRWAGRLPIIIGGSLASLPLIAALVSLVATPFSPYQIDVPHKLLQPSGEHWLGTDALGRDELSLLLTGAQVSLLVGITAVAGGLSIGVLLGLIAATRKGWLEEFIMRVADLGFAFPAVLSAIMLRAVSGGGISNSIVAIGAFNIPVFARVSRAAANVIFTREFILAARVAGKGPIAIVYEHILPNILPTLIVQATLQFGLAILAEAALSYLGLGAQPPQPSWGRMLNDAQSLLFEAPRLALFPGIAIALTVLGLNLLGDGIRNILDPRLSRDS
jgi:peptide/nickel transport system permease protein